MAEKSERVQRGRAAVGRLAWGRAHDDLLAAEQDGLLTPSDCELLASAAHLRHDLPGFARALEHAADGHRTAGDVRAAARCLFWLGFTLLHQGEIAQANGWLARAARLVADETEDSTERALLSLPGIVADLWEGRPAEAAERAERAARVGARDGDPDLLAAALHFQGRALLRSDHIADGLRLLDESMLGVVGGDVRPYVSGSLYCAVINACEEVFDVGRVQEWTASFDEWTGRQPELITFTGECAIHRAEILLLKGLWGQALQEAELAGDLLSRIADSLHLGQAWYLRGEIHRRCGDDAQAVDAYREASANGCEIQPGLALLRLRQGDLPAAIRAVERLAVETPDGSSRAKFLPAYVMIMIAAGEFAKAQTAAEELSRIAEQFDSPYLRAATDQALGHLLVETGEVAAALAVLRRCAQQWRGFEAPYEVASVRVLIGRACRSLGDGDAAEMEFDAARASFDRLGARPDATALATLTQHGEQHGLTDRELEVLRLLASGRTNHAIAEVLVLSVKTIDRHVSNIFAKLGVSSRSAATAYAYRRHIV